MEDNFDKDFDRLFARDLKAAGANAQPDREEWGGLSARLDKADLGGNWYRWLPWLLLPLLLLSNGWMMVQWQQLRQQVAMVQSNALEGMMPIPADPVRATAIIYDTVYRTVVVTRQVIETSMATKATTSQQALDHTKLLPHALEPTHNQIGTAEARQKEPLTVKKEGQYLENETITDKIEQRKLASTDTLPQTRNPINDTLSTPPETQNSKLETPNSPAETQNSKLETQNSPTETQNSKLETQNSPTETQNSKLETQNSPTETQNSKLETQNSPTETQNSKLETQNSPTETQNSKLETQNAPTETQNSPPWHVRFGAGLGPALLVDAHDIQLSHPLVAQLQFEIGLGRHWALVSACQYQTFGYETERGFDLRLGIEPPMPPGQEYKLRHVEGSTQAFVPSLSVQYLLRPDKKLSGYLGAGYALRLTQHGRAEYEFVHTGTGAEYQEERTARPLYRQHNAIVQAGLEYAILPRLSLWGGIQGLGNPRSRRSFSLAAGMLGIKYSVK